MNTDIIPFDLHRLFLGDQPMLFYAEILLRTLLIYGYTLLMVRWIGGRGVAQLSMVEFVLVIALGSAVGDSMFYPDVPVLVAMAVITVVIGVNKGLDLLIVRSDKAKDLIDGRPVALVEDGRLLPEGLAMRDLGPAEVKAMLRQAGIRNLGQVECAYLESGGGISVFHRDDPKPGLSLLPPDAVIPERFQVTALTDPRAAPDGQACCAGCGNMQSAALVLPDAPCPGCGFRRWVAPHHVGSRKSA